MFRKITACVVVCVLLFFNMVPVHGAEAIAAYQAQLVQNEFDEINELITLAGVAARAGDLETAQKYEDILVARGVEIVATDDPQKALVQLGIEEETAASTYAVPDMEDTEAVHWFKYSVTNWYNWRTFGNFDLISLRAESWDDTNSILVSGWNGVTNTKPKTYATSVLENIGIELVKFGIEKTFDEYEDIASVVMTVGDVFLDTDANSAEFTTMEMTSGSVDFRWLGESSVTFWYVRSNGSGRDYALYCVEEKITLDYDCDFEVRYRYPDGHVETDLATTKVDDLKLGADSYGDMTRPCDACKNKEFRMHNVGNFVLICGDEEIIVEGMYTPYIPEEIRDAKDRV